ncbi:MAG TPA: hypothetical protein PLL33_13050, partial [Paracoccus sp. (in: a-proteobacteria)]|nr:hypothetical protein [Paracoccus sp. (in: a-proteobacteria)]
QALTDALGGGTLSANAQAQAATAQPALAEPVPVQPALTQPASTPPAVPEAPARPVLPGVGN